MWFTILGLVLILQRGIFTVKVTFFDHVTQGFVFVIFHNIKSKWNKFKWEILDNSNYDNFHGDGDFSHEYVIMHKYFGKKTRNVKNEYISFYIQLNMFSCMTISYTSCQCLGPQILSLVKTKNQPIGKKKFIFLAPFLNGFCSLQKNYILYYLIKCIIWTLPNIIYALLMKENWSQLHSLLHSFWFL